MHACARRVDWAAPVWRQTCSALCSQVFFGGDYKLATLFDIRTKLWHIGHWLSACLAFNILSALFHDTNSSKMTWLKLRKAMFVPCAALHRAFLWLEVGLCELGRRDRLLPAHRLKNGWALPRAERGGKERCSQVSGKHHVSWTIKKGAKCVWAGQDVYAVEMSFTFFVVIGNREMATRSTTRFMSSTTTFLVV